MIKNYIWQEIALEVISAARSRTSISDFKKHCQLAPVQAGKSYYDRQRVAEQLLLQGLIEIDNGNLRLRDSILKNIPEWLMEGLSLGLPVAWKTISEIDPSNKISNKIDLDLLSEIGRQGELEVMKQLMINLSNSVAHRIKHVSLTDDSAGFDIFAPSVLNSDETLLLEVKTSSKPGNFFSFFISRNEARIASKNINWRLVAVRRCPEGYSILGNIVFDQFSQHLPTNISNLGAWETAKISIPVDLFSKSLP